LPRARDLHGVYRGSAKTEIVVILTALELVLTMLVRRAKVSHCAHEALGVDDSQSQRGRSSDCVVGTFIFYLCYRDRIFRYGRLTSPVIAGIR
jgi:hypothetical protein